MTIMIEISPEEEARLREWARQQGQEAEAVAGAFVRAGLDAAPAVVTEERHAVLIQRLRDAGLLTELPTHPGQTTSFQPIKVQGLPVSQTLLEDRE